MYEKFLALKEEKKTRIINAALTVFAKNGYKKAAIDDIVKLSGISKGILFHYFETKKNFYLFLYEYCSKLIKDKIDKEFDLDEKDFFKRVSNSIRIKFEMLRTYPHIYDFFVTVYFNDMEIMGDELIKINTKWAEISSKMLFEGLDLSRFKDGVDTKNVFRILLWCGEGLLKEKINSKENILIVDFQNEFDKILNLLKINFYKEEYLK